jgi:hypothetical protein
MVYRKRKFTEVDGAILLEATEKFGRSLREAQCNAPYGSEIFKAVETLWASVRHVQITLTGNPEYGSTPMHCTHNNPPPKQVKLRTWDTIPGLSTLTIWAKPRSFFRDQV